MIFEPEELSEGERDRRLREVASTSAPAGAVISMPAMPPMVITEPISPLSQPWASRNTPRNGPMPACMSAMKKFSACKDPIARVPCPPDA